MRPAIAFLILATFWASPASMAQLRLIPPTAPPASPRVVQQLFAEWMAHIRANSGRSALRVAEEFVDSETFASLSPEIQHPIIGLEASALLLNENHEEARAAFVRSSESEYATALDWVGRAESAGRLGLLDEFAADLIVIIQRWPDVFADIPSGNFDEIIDRVHEGHPGSSAYRSLLEAIATNVPGSINAVNLSRFWRDLVLEHIEAGNLDEAILSTGRIARTWTLISMRADRRFDTLTAAAPDLFDITQAARSELELALEMRANEPRSLRVVTQLTSAYEQTEQFEEALALVDMVISLASPAVIDQPYWEDPGLMNWVLDERARLLAYLGRWDEALEQRESASMMSERGRSNVSQTINLADLYAKLGKIDLARQTLNEVPDRTSDYGDALILSIKVNMAVQESDSGDIRRNLRRIRDFEDAAPSVVLLALARAGELDEAAEILIRQLRDPDQRLSTLVDLQKYRPVPEALTMSDSEILSRLTEMPNVQAVLNEVGRIDSYDVVY